MAENEPTWADAYWLQPNIIVGNEEMPRRKYVEYPGATVVDVPQEDRIRVTVSGGGGSSFAEELIVTGTGSLNDVVTVSGGLPVRVIKFTGAAPVVSGLGSASLRGGEPILVLTTGGNLVLQNEGSGSAAANRIVTGTGADLTLSDEECVFLTPDANGSRWRVQKVSAATLAGDVSGAAGANTVDKIKGVSVLAGTPLAGQSLVYDSVNTRLSYDYSFRSVTVATTGAITSLVTTDAATGKPYTGIRFTGAAPVLHGLVGARNGESFRLYTSGGPLVIKYDSATEPTAANRIVTPTGADVTIAQNSGVDIFWSAGTSRWHVLQVPASGTFSAGGDLTGTSTSQTVSKIQGVVISGTPASGYSLIASSPTAAAWTATSGTFTAGGDLTGTSTSQTVSKIQGVAISGTPSCGQVLLASSSTAAAWSNVPTQFVAGGDLSGSATSQTVQRINGVTVSGTPASGYHLVANSSSLATWQAVSSSGEVNTASNLGSGSGWFAGKSGVDLQFKSLTVSAPLGLGVNSTFLNIALPGLSTFGTAGQSIRVASGGSTLEWYTAGGSSSTGSSGQIDVADGSGGWSAATNVLAGSGYLSVGSSPASAGSFRVPSAVSQIVVAGTKTLLASSSTEGFLFSDSSYTNQTPTGRIYCSSSMVLGLGASNYISLTTNLIGLQKPIYGGGNPVAFATSLVDFTGVTTKTLSSAEYTNLRIYATRGSGTTCEAVLPNTDGVAFLVTCAVLSGFEVKFTHTTGGAGATVTSGQTRWVVYDTLQSKYVLAS